MKDYKNEYFGLLPRYNYDFNGGRAINVSAISQITPIKWGDSPKDKLWWDIAMPDSSEDDFISAKYSSYFDKLTTGRCNNSGITKEAFIEFVFGESSRLINYPIIPGSRSHFCYTGDRNIKSWPSCHLDRLSNNYSSGACGILDCIQVGYVVFIGKYIRDALGDIGMKFASVGDAASRRSVRNMIIRPNLINAPQMFVPSASISVARGARDSSVWFSEKFISDIIEMIQSKEGRRKIATLTITKAIDERAPLIALPCYSGGFFSYSALQIMRKITGDLFDRSFSLQRYTEISEDFCNSFTRRTARAYRMVDLFPSEESR